MPHISRRTIFVSIVLGSSLVAVPLLAQNDSTLTSPYRPIYTFDQRMLSGLAYRDLRFYLTLVPGMIEHDGQLSVRGSRGGDITYMLDGLSMLNPVRRELVPPFIREALEQISVDPGATDAVHAGGSAGVVAMRVRTGGEQLSVSASYTGDEFVKAGEEFSGATARGQHRATVTIGGPTPGMSTLRFFAAYQHEIERNRQPLFLSPFALNDFGPHASESDPFPEVIAFRKNFLPGNWAGAHTVIGSLAFVDTLQPFTVRVTGMWDQRGHSMNTGWPDALISYFARQRSPELRTTSGFLGFQGSFKPDAQTAVTGTLRYSDRFEQTLDPAFGSDWRFFTDSLANAARGYPGFISRWRGPSMYFGEDRFWLYHETAPNTSYRETRERGWEAGFRIERNMGSELNLALGGSFEWWTFRRFDLHSISNYMAFLYSEHSDRPRTFPSEVERRIMLTKGGRVDHFGYDIDGREVDAGFDAPRRSRFGRLFAVGTFHNDHWDLSAGLRLEYGRSGIMIPNVSPAGYDRAMDILDERQFKEQDPTMYLLPDIRASVAFGPRTLIYGGFGMSVRYPSLGDLMMDAVSTSRTMTSGSIAVSPVGYLAGMERRAQLDLGIRYAHASGFVVSASGYYVRSSGLLRVRRETYAFVSDFPTLVNDDASSSKGVTVGVVRERRDGVLCELLYTVSDGRGTGSTPYSTWGTSHSDSPLRAATTSSSLLDQHRLHQITACLDAEDDGSWSGTMFEGVGAALVLRYTSGRPYTRLVSPQYSTEYHTPWNGGMVLVEAKVLAEPTGEVNTLVTSGSLSVDVSLRRSVVLGPVTCEFLAVVTNLFNAKNVLGVYPETGSSTDDGWLGSPLSRAYISPAYVSMYRAINLENRWAYMMATGADMFSEPREVRLGMRIML